MIIGKVCMKISLGKLLVSPVDRKTVPTFTEDSIETSQSFSLTNFNSFSSRNFRVNVGDGSAVYKP